MKFGLLICNYNCAEYIHFLDPWFKFDSVSICVIDGQFEGFPIEGKSIHSTDESLSLLSQLPIKLIVTQTVENEATTRNHGVKWLKEQGVDAIISIGMDEKFTEKEIAGLLRYVDINPFAAVFKIHYKNLCFTKETYTEGFCPHRVWRMNTSNYELGEFKWDDDMNFFGKITRDIKMDRDMPIQVVPKNVCNPLHYTWLDDLRSHRKVAYQLSHFSHCSFKVEDGKLKFDENFYKKNGLPIPELITINNNEP